MAQTKVGWFTKIDPALRDAMRQYKADAGVPEAQQVDRALREWLAARGAWPLRRTSQRRRP